MKDTRILCIFTTLLGNKAFAHTAINVLDRLSGLKLTYILVGLEDYAKYPCPWPVRLTNPWQAQFLARQKAGPVLGQPFDILLVNAWELVVAFRDVALRMPAAAMVDSVPATVDAQLRARGLNSWKRRLAHPLHHRAFAKAAREFDFFLPTGSDGAESLERNYGVSPERCFVTLAPQDLEFWKTAERDYSRPLRLLFVGNDFVRKGGDFLLRLYSEHLSNTCTLKIASNDPVLAGRQLPRGVQCIRGRNREQLLDIYRDSDVFVLPTQQDYMPQVLAEALAAGLPCIANDVGGIRDLVRNGETGFLMPRDAQPVLWAAHLNRLAADPVELRRMSASARCFAEQMLSLTRFESLIIDVIERLRGKL